MLWCRHASFTSFNVSVTLDEAGAVYGVIVKQAANANVTLQVGWPPNIQVGFKKYDQL